MNQCGPDWHMLQFQRMRDVSDFMIWKECVHWAGAGHEAVRAG